MNSKQNCRSFLVVILYKNKVSQLKIQAQVLQDINDRSNLFISSSIFWIQNIHSPVNCQNLGACYPKKYYLKNITG
jgi:hypothetical protein